MRNIAIAFLTVLLCLCTVSVNAQTTNPTPAGFVASSDVLAIDYNGTWSVGNLTTESYDLLDYGPNFSNRLFVQGVELTAPGPGLSVFGGGVLWQPDISTLFNKTNLTGGNFLVFVDGSAGVGIPNTGSDRVSAIFGAGAKYILSDNVTWNTMRCEVVFFGSSRYPACSTGISAYFGGNPASPALSSHVRNGLLRRMASTKAKLALVKQ